jgi:hypothetical protein
MNVSIAYFQILVPVFRTFTSFLSLLYLQGPAYMGFSPLRFPDLYPNIPIIYFLLCLDSSVHFEPVNNNP